MLICDESIDAQMASTRLRAQQTAAPVVARALLHGIRTRVPRDQCRRAGDAGGRPPATDQHLQRKALDWASGELDPVIAGVDAGTRPQMLAAFDQVVAEAESSGAATAVLVSQGDAIAAPAPSRVAPRTHQGPAQESD
jgi:probable phosphoglycerate mutase